MNMDRKSFCIVNGKRFKHVIPDGGWGYVICVAVSLNLVTSTCFVLCFGVLFKEFLEEHNVSSTSVTLLSGINCVCLAVSGFVTGGLLKMITVRKLGYIAALIFNLGSLGCIFVRNFTELIIVQGLLQNTGIGILINLGYTILNDYFLKKRLFVFSFCKTMMGISWMVSPMFVKWSLDEYGFRNTLLIILGIGMNIFVGVTLMQPIELHRNMVEDVAEEEFSQSSKESQKEKTEHASELILNMDTKCSEVPVIVMGKEKTHEELENLITQNHLQNQRKSLETTDSDEAREMVDLVRKLSIMDFPMDQLPMKKNKLTMKRLIELMDLTLFKDSRFLISCICICFAFFLDTNYALLFPLALYEKGWDTYHVALAISLFGAGDIVLKISFVVVSKFVHLDSRKFYLVGLILGLITRLGIQWINDVTAVMVLFCIMGTSRCFFHILSPLLIADMVETKRFPSAHGLVMLTYGVVNLLFAPLVGAVRDLSRSYSVTFLMLIGCFAFVSVLFASDLYFNRKKNNKIDDNIQQSRK